MAPRLALHSERNRRWGLKYPFEIFKGDLVVDSEEEDLEEPHPTADVDRKEGSEHHLQAVLATKAAFIPTPGTIRIIDNHDPANRTWVDPISYLKTTQTCEEACSNALVEHEYNYFMDEIDKQWLDTNNERAREGGTTAQSDGVACQGKVVPISEDEFELVMALLEKITDQKSRFLFYEPFFSNHLPSTMFVSYDTPSWIPPPPLVVQIAQSVYEHWKQRRSLSKGRKLRPSLSYDESDSLDEAYICFRRNKKPVRKTRASLANNAPKLARLDRDLQQVLEIAKALLTRETRHVMAIWIPVPKEMAATSDNWKLIVQVIVLEMLADASIPWR
ncbi:enhancer of polycomb-like-domain-containing protein [Mycena leptocephala]|nr:enhancer of polycomb-like-domain-containing protein [Mycena leptocephala]